MLLAGPYRGVVADLLAYRMREFATRNLGDLTQSQLSQFRYHDELLYISERAISESV